MEVSMNKNMDCFNTKTLGSNEIWTRIAGFRVQSVNHYTVESLRIDQ